MYDDGKNINNIFDAEPDPFDDLDIELDNDASIHPLTIRDGEDQYLPDGFEDEKAQLKAAVDANEDLDDPEVDDKVK